MSTFYAKNNKESTRALFNKRLIYRVDSNPDNVRHLVNFNFGEKALFGRVDRQYIPIVLNYDGVLTGLKAPQFAQSRSVRSLSYVTNAFNDMAREFRRKIMQGEISGDSKYLGAISAYKGLVSPVKAYNSHIENYAQAFRQIFITRDIKVRDFDEFMGYFMAYLERTSRTIPFTQSGFIKSRYSTVMNTGLAIEIADLDASDDDTKIQDFIDDPNWKCYVDMCNRYGFMIDSNIPWRIVADIGSEGMSTYTAGLGLGTATAVIAAQFRKGYSIDNQLLVKTLLGIYDTVKKQSFQELEVCNRSTISHTIYPETYTAEGLKEKYSPEYFIDLYCRIRFFEEESQFSPDEQASLIDDCLEISHLETPTAALKVFEIVLNKPFDYRGSLSYIRESNKAKRKLRETENG